MKINNIWIPIVAAALILVVVASGLVGLTSILNLLILVIPVVLIGYLLIAAKCCLVKMQDSKTSPELNAKMEILKESMDRIEKKVDKIDRILEKVSE